MWVAVFKPLTSLVLRPPWGLFHAAVYGPAVAPSTLSYPLPSTMAGALAFIAYRRGLCGGSISDRDFELMDKCLSQALGKDYIIRPGLARIGGELYYYDGWGYRRLQDDRPLAPPKSRHVGVALDRASKTNLVVKGKGHIFSVSSLGPSLGPERLEVVALIRSGSSYLEELLRDRPLVRLGGEGSYAGQAVVSLESLKDGNPLVRASGARVVARLATPALLELKDLELVEPGTPVIASKKVLENIVRALLMQSGVGNCAEPVLKGPEDAGIPGNELQLEIAQPGWSTPDSSPRKPHLIVPAGACMKLELKSDKCAEEIAWRGLGAHSSLGWGTVILKPYKIGGLTSPPIRV